MTLRRLHNEDWGFDSNCFVCEPRNDGGLRIPFDHDEGTGTVVAAFSLSERFSGAPSYVHGGVSLAVLDEAMAWATIAVGGKFAVTVETSTRFVRPVLVGKQCSVEAHLSSQNEERIETAAVIRDTDGKLCAETTASFRGAGCRPGCQGHRGRRVGARSRLPQVTWRPDQSHTWSRGRRADECSMGQARR